MDLLTVAIMPLQSDAARDKVEIHFRYSPTQYRFQSQSAWYQNKKQRFMQ